MIIYHKNCADGFGAAMAFYRYGVPKHEFYAATHGDEPPDCTGRSVIMVDFCYKLPALKKIVDQADSVLILDHHKSAAQEITPINNENIKLERLDHIDVDKVCYMATSILGKKQTKCVAYFNVGRSGAGIAWDALGRPRPDLIDYIEDRDLWKFNLPNSKEVAAAVFGYPYDFTVWDELLERDIYELIEEGKSILRKQQKDINELIDASARSFAIGGTLVPVINVPYTLGSDACHILAKDKPFAAYYWDSKDYRNFGLRSNKEGLDVSEIARLYGGGGHKHAAGFRVSRDHELARN